MIVCGIRLSYPPRRHRVGQFARSAKTKLSWAETPNRKFAIRPPNPTPRPISTPHTTLPKCSPEAPSVQRGPSRTGFHPRSLLLTQRPRLPFPHAHDQRSFNNSSRGRQSPCRAHFAVKSSCATLLQPLRNLHPAPQRPRKPNLHGTTSSHSAERVGESGRAAL